MNPRHKNPLALELGAVVVVLALLVWWGYMARGVDKRPAPAVPYSTVKVVNTNTPAPLAQMPKTVPLAQKKADVDVSACKPNPKSIGVDLGKSLVFENRDNKAHIIQFTPKVLFTVTAKGKEEIPFNFDGISVTRNYLCDGKEAGTVVITKKI